ncbi:MAG: VCBS repeat-containing protein, partial [Planctomycetes bacterium]|nr:VCBS repeat-containing protein [Planctomycetota bacterium]
LQKTPRKLEGPLVLSSGREGFAPRSVETADLDGDARLDLLAADAASDRLVIFRRGRGAGVAWAELPVGGGDATRGPRHAAAADLDADGDLDLASANAGGDDVAVFLQEGPWAFGREDGQGSRRPHAALGGPSLTRSPAAVALADLDRDGALDLVVAGEGEPDFARHRFPGSGLAVFLAPGRQLQAAPAPAIEPDLLVGASGETRGCAWVEAADLDSDGSLDLAAAEVGGSLAVFLQDAAGVFRLAAGRPTLVDAGGFSEGPVSVDSADLDRDGRLDLVSSNEFAGDLAVFHQRGRGQFPSAPDARLGGAGITSGPKRALAIDLDGDADPDLVAASSRADSLAVFWGGR